MSDKSCHMDIISTCGCSVQVYRGAQGYCFIYYYNESLSIGDFPDVLKSVMSVPGLMKNNLDLDELKNHRPISNLTFLSKIIEKCVHKQVIFCTETNK